MSGTLGSRLSAADLCRAKGWGVGTRLVGDEGYGPTVIEITALGEASMLARAVFSKGKAVNDREHSYTLSCREWHKVEDHDASVLIPRLTTERDALKERVQELEQALADVRRAVGA